MANSTTTDEPVYAPFIGTMGVTFAQVFASVGSAYGIAKAGTGISCMSISRPDLVMKSLIPVIMAGIISIYGLVVSIIVTSRVEPVSDGYKLIRSFSHLAAGLTCGFTGAAAGYAIGIVGDTGVRAHSLQPRLFVVMVLILIFAEVLGLYGMIVALIFVSQ